MDLPSVTNVISTIIGGILAAGAGLFLSWYNQRSKKIERSNFIKQALIDDLKNSISIYEKIQNDWSISSLIWFVSINEFKKSREIFKKYEENLYLLDLVELRNRIRKYYFRSETLILTLENIQIRKYALDNKYWDIFREIKLREPKISDDDVAKMVRDAMKNEQNELNTINQLIPINVIKIDQLINEAQNIINLIDKV